MNFNKGTTKLVYIIGVALLLVSLCAGLIAVPQVYAGSPSGARHAAVDGGGDSGGGGDAGAPAGSTGATTPAEETPATGDDTGTGDEGAGTNEGTTGDQAGAIDGPGVYTDKADYAPYEIPVITGTGFAANAEVTLAITAPDGGTTYVTGSTDSEGNFTALYEGFLCSGEFSLTATDGTNTAVTTFTDGGGTTYHDVTFKQTGLEYSLVGGGTIVLSLGSSGSTLVPYNLIDGVSPNTWYEISIEHGQRVYYSYSATVASTTTGIRFNLDNVSGISSGSKVYSDQTITGNYDKQYQLTIISAHGSTHPAAGGDYWYDAGTNLDKTYEKPYVSDLTVVEGGITYTFDEWTGDGGSDESKYGNVYTHDFIMDGPRTVEATWTCPVIYYDVTFTQTGLEPGLVNGVTVVLTVGSTPVPYSSIDGSPWYVTSVENGDPIYYSYSTVVAATAAGTQFALKSVSGLANGAPVYSNTTISGTYGKQYQLTIVSPYGSTNPTVGIHWYDADTHFRNNPTEPGSVQTPYVTPLEETVGGTTYQFVEWIGDGPSDHSADEIVGDIAYTHNFNLDGPRTVEAIWTEAITYYDVTFTQTGLESGLVNGVTLVLTVGTTSVPYSSIDGAPWYVTSVEKGDPIYYSYSTIVAATAAGTQFALKSVSGLGSGSNVNSNETITGNYGKQYYLTVISAYGNTSGEGWYDASTCSNPVYAYAGLDTGLVEGGIAGVDDERYVFDDWDVDASGHDWHSSNSIEMTRPKTALADWDTQYYLLVNNGGHSTTYGTNWYNAGQKAYFGVNDTTIYVGSDTRFKFDEWDGVGSGAYNGDDPTHYVYMNNYIVETATWNTQYKLTVASDPSLSILLNTLHGSDTGWYNAGTEFRWNPSGDQEKSPYINNSSTPVYVNGYHDTRYQFIEWTGDGGSDESHSGKTYTDNFNLNSPMTVTANWNTQFYLSVNNGGHGSVYGSGWYDENADATFGVISTLVPASDGKRYVFDDWDGWPCGAYNGSDPVHTIQMTKHFVETATWDTQYRLIMYSTITDAMGTVAGGTTDPSVGEYWYNSGTWVEIQAYAPSVGDGERYVWNGWTGTPEDDDGGCHYYSCGCGCGCGGDCEGYTGLGTGTTHSAWIEMKCPITETASWDHEYRLIMESYVTDASGTVAGGTTDPSVGEHWFLAGTDLDISAFAPTLTYLDGERFTFDGWAGSGCGEYTGPDETHGITMGSAITETATWLHEYRLIMEANYGTTDPSLGEHWYLAGLNVPITAISPVPLPFESYAWNGWTGTGCGSYIGMDNPSFVNMYSPITQTAEWIYVPLGRGSNIENETTGLVIVIDVEGTVVSYPVSPDGALLENVLQNSPDGNLTLAIPVGTIVLNPDGTPAYLNADPDVIGIVAGAVASAGDATIIQAYDLTPAGLYFVNGQATLTTKYNADSVPEGTSPTWASYDAATGNWIDVETSGAIAAGGEPTAACNTSSLTVFALIAR